MSKKLGYTATDRITGFKGVVIGQCQYITGCNQLLIQPCDPEKESRWFDEQRCVVANDETPFVLNNGNTPGFDKPAPRI